MWEKGCYNKNRMQCKSSRFAYFLRRNCVNSFQELVQSIDWGSLTDALLRVLGVFLCLTVHETCHGLAAYALGDPTAKREHRLSLNPLHHIDWFGLAAMLLVGFGWAKPVPVNMMRFRSPKRGMALTALAGPVSNVLLALVFLFLYGLLYRALYSVQFLLDMIWLIKRCLFSMDCQRYESNDFSVTYRYICTSGFMLPCRTMRPARCSKSPGRHGASKSCSAINLS